MGKYESLRFVQLSFISNFNFAKQWETKAKNNEQTQRMNKEWRMSNKNKVK